MTIHRRPSPAVAGALACALACAAQAPALAQQAPTHDGAASSPNPRAPAEPSAAHRQEAAVRFKKGLELFKEGDYAAALMEFRRAYEIAPNFNVLYNIGQVHFQLLDYPNALAALERYLADGGSEVPPTRRADVQRDIAKLRARVATIEVSSAVTDAEVAVDDLIVGRTPLAKPLTVSAGRHRVTVSKAGYAPSSKLVEIASAEVAKVALDPIEDKASAPVPPPPPLMEPPRPAPPPPVAPPPAPPPPRSVPVAGILVTGALAAGAAVTGILALRARGALEDEVKSPTATRGSLDDASAKVTGFALAADILTAGAVVSASVTLYLGLRSSTKPAAVPAEPETAGPRDVRLGLGPGSLVVLGRF